MAELEQQELELTEETPPEGVEHLPPENEPEPEPTPSREDELQTQLQTERETSARLQGQIDARNEQPPPPAAKEEPPPKEFTRQELRAAVTEGKLDEDGMEQIWADQNHAKTMRDTESLINDRDARRTVETTVDTEYDKYTAAFPDLKDTKSDIWGKVKAEYDYLIKLGDKDNRTTELKALRSALGSNERIQERTADLRQTPQGGAASGSTSGDRPVDLWNRVPKHLKSYYKYQVEQGYMNLDDVKKDIPYMKARPN